MTMMTEMTRLMILIAEMVIIFLMFILYQLKYIFNYLTNDIT